MLRKYGILIAGLVVAVVGLVLSVLSATVGTSTAYGIICAIVGLVLCVAGYVWQKRN